MKTQSPYSHTALSAPAKTIDEPAMENTKSRDTKKLEKELQDTVATLAKMGDWQYENMREQTAKSLGIRVTKLDNLVDKARRAPTTDAPEFMAAPIPWPEPVDGKSVLQELQSTLSKYCILPEGADLLISLWILYSHAHDAFEISPILAIQSPEKRCGKTTVLRVISELVAKPLPSINISPAALFRVIDAHKPTLLLDEADTYIPGNDDLRNILNGGHLKRAGSVLRAVGDDHVPTSFNAWSPKVIASIGTLDETVQDRSIVINLRRKSVDDVVSGFRERDALGLEPLMRKVARWAKDNRSCLAALDPDLPEVLDDRAKDNAACLAAIADTISTDVGNELRAVLITNAREAAKKEEPGESTWLLADCREIFSTWSRPDITSAELIKELSRIEESPWATYQRGRQISAKTLAGLFRRFGISIHKTAQARVYRVHDFKDAFTRYLGSPS